MADAEPLRRDEPLRNPAAIARRGSDVADVRQHLLAEQFERFHQLVGIFRARGVEKQIDDAATDLFFHTPGSEDPDELMEGLELFGKKVLPHIRDI